MFYCFESQTVYFCTTSLPSLSETQRSSERRPTFMAKLLSQLATAQLKGFSPWWSPRMWLSRLKRQVNRFSQPTLGHGSLLFSPECVRSSCRCRNQPLLKSFLHASHCTLAAKRQTDGIRCTQCNNPLVGFFFYRNSHLCVLSCVSHIPSTCCPWTSTHHSHRHNLRQRDWCLNSTSIIKKSLTVLI